MTTRYRTIAVVALIVVAASPVLGHAVILDFELGVSTGVQLNDVDPTYGGFTWDPDFGIVNLDYYNSTYSNTSSFPSGTNAAFIGFGALTVEFGGQVVDLNLTYNSVPEPSTFLLLGAGLLGLVVFVRLRKRQRSQNQ